MSRRVPTCTFNFPKFPSILTPALSAPWTLSLSLWNAPPSNPLIILQFHTISINIPSYLDVQMFRWNRKESRILDPLNFNIDIYYYRMNDTILSTLLNPKLTLTTVWNTGETGDIHTSKVHKKCCYLWIFIFPFGRKSAIIVKNIIKPFKYMLTL